MIILNTTLLIIILVELLFSPKLDKSKAGIYLWYGQKSKRKFIKLW